MSENFQCTAESPCTAVQLLVQRQQQDSERMDKMEDKLEFFIDCLRNRLPLWATALFTVGGGVIGVLITLVVK
jgi:hypothetical protein